VIKRVTRKNGKKRKKIDFPDLEDLKEGATVTISSRAQEYYWGKWETRLVGRETNDPCRTGRKNFIFPFPLHHCKPNGNSPFAPLAPVVKFYLSLSSCILF